MEATRFNWFAQLLVRMGEDLPPLDESDENSDSIVRKYINKEWIDRKTLEEKTLPLSKSKSASLTKSIFPKSVDLIKRKLSSLPKMMMAFMTKMEK